MSVASWPRQFGRLGLSVLVALFGWLLIAPIAALVPKRRDRIAVIGRQHGRFVDNAKYFFIQAATDPAVDVRFVSEYPDVVDAIVGYGRLAMRYPGFASIWLLLRSGCVIVDSMDWGGHLRRFLLVRTKVVQLWHGVGFKRIEIDRWRHEVGRTRWASTPWVFSLRRLLYRFNGRIVRYAAVCSTSCFYRDEVFSRAFLARHFPITGYPRNAFSRFREPDTSLAWDNVDRTLRDRLPGWVASGRKIVIVAPTFRDSGAAPLMLDGAATEALNAFCESAGFEFVFKFHPSEQHASQVSGAHLHVCDAASDLYPALAHAHALITDYSSIYMDYLLLDRPVLFLNPDDNYAVHDRQTQFDVRDMMPGPRVRSWNELLRLLPQQLQSDTHAGDRARLRQLAFDGLDQAESVPRLLEFMRAQRWLA